MIIMFSNKKGRRILFIDINCFLKIARISTVMMTDRQNHQKPDRDDTMMILEFVLAMILDVLLIPTDRYCLELVSIV